MSSSTQASVEQQREHFNSIAERYFAARKNPNHLALKDLIWKSFFARNREIAREVRTVLEPMCGMGEGYDIITTYLTPAIDYKGFDYSENMVDIARKARPGLAFSWSDVTTHDPGGEEVDLVIVIGGLHHVYSQTQRALTNLARALRPGGLFVSLEPTHNNVITRAARRRIYRTNDLFDEDTEQGYEYVDLQRHFTDAGFRLVDQVYPGLAAYVLYYNPDAFPALNVGGTTLVRSLFALDRLAWANFIGRSLSFATLSLWRKTA